MIIPKPNNILFLNLENDLTDIGPHSINFTATSPKFDTPPQKLYGTYALGTNVGATPISPSSLSSLLAGKSKYTIEFDLFMSGLVFGSTNKIVTFYNGGTNVLNLFVNGPSVSFGLQPPKIGFDWTPTISYSTNVNFTFTTGLYSRIGFVVDSTDEALSLYVDGTRAIYQSGGIYTSLISPFPGFTNLVIGESNNHQYIKNVSITLSSYPYTLGDYSGVSFYLSGYGSVNQNGGYSVDLISRTGTIAAPIQTIGLDGQIPLDSLPSNNAYDYTGLLLKKNGWVAGKYDFPSGITTGSLTII